MISGVSRSLPPTKRMPQGVAWPSRSSTTANSCSLGLILMLKIDWKIRRSSDPAMVYPENIYLFFIVYFFFWPFLAEPQAARDCNPLSVLFDRKAAQVLILKYNSYSFLQQQQRQQSTLRHKFVSYIHICTYMYNLYPPATATTCWETWIRLANPNR